MNPLVVTNQIFIHAPIESVWDTLVNPQKTKIYMFGCETISDWNIGSALLWEGEHEGNKMVFVKGYILDLQYPNKLIYSVIDPFAKMEDIPQNYLRVTYDLRSIDEHTELTVSQDGFEHAADGQKRYKHVYNDGKGWEPILIEIKKLVEHSK